MAKGIVKTHIKEGEYTVDILSNIDWAKNRLAVLDSLIAESEAKKTQKQAELTAARNALLEADDVLKDAISSGIQESIKAASRNLVILRAKAKKASDDYLAVLDDIAALKGEKTYIEINIPSEKESADIWSADYTLDLKGEQIVGIIESPQGERRWYNIQPGWKNDDDPDWDTQADYNTARDGQRFPAIAMTGAGLFVTRAWYPAWQKWIPLHRLGTITKLDGDKCDVVLKFDDSSECPGANGNINVLTDFKDVKIDYMDCNGAAFEDGDEVIVKFSTEREIKQADVSAKLEPFNNAKEKEKTAQEELAAAEAELDRLIELQRAELLAAGRSQFVNEDLYYVKEQKAIVSEKRNALKNSKLEREEAEKWYCYYNYLLQNNFPHRVYSWDSPSVIGFKKEPRDCPGGFVFWGVSPENIINGGKGGYYLVRWNKLKNGYNSRWISPDNAKKYLKNGFISDDRTGAISIDTSDNYVDIKWKDGDNSWAYKYTYTFYGSEFGLKNAVVIGGMLKKIESKKYAVIAVRHENDDGKPILVSFYKLEIDPSRKYSQFIGEELPYVFCGQIEITGAEDGSQRVVKFNKSGTSCFVFGTKRKLGKKRADALNLNFHRPYVSMYYYTPIFYDIFVCTQVNFDDVCMVTGTADITEYYEDVFTENAAKISNIFLGTGDGNVFHLWKSYCARAEHVWSVLPEQNFVYFYGNTVDNTGNFKPTYLINIPVNPNGEALSDFLTYKTFTVDKKILSYARLCTGTESEYAGTITYFNFVDQRELVFNDIFQLESYQSFIGNPDLWGETPYITGDFIVEAHNYKVQSQGTPYPSGELHYEWEDKFIYSNMIAAAWRDDDLVKTILKCEYRRAHTNTTVIPDGDLLQRTAEVEDIIECKASLFFGDNEINLGDERFCVKAAGRRNTEINTEYGGYFNEGNASKWAADSKFTFTLGDKVTKFTGWPRYETPIPYKWSRLTLNFFEFYTGNINYIPFDRVVTGHASLIGLDAGDMYLPSLLANRPDSANGVLYASETVTPYRVLQPKQTGVDPTITSVRMNYLHALKNAKGIPLRHTKGNRIHLLFFDPRNGAYAGIKRVSSDDDEKQELIVCIDGQITKYTDTKYIDFFGDYLEGGIEKRHYATDFHKIIPADGNNIFLSYDTGNSGGNFGYNYDSPPAVQYESDFYGNSLISIVCKLKTLFQAQTEEVYTVISNGNIQELINRTSLPITIKGLLNVSQI